MKCQVDWCLKLIHHEAKDHFDYALPQKLGLTSSLNESVTKYKCSIIQTDQNTNATKYKYDKIQKFQNTSRTKYKRTKYKWPKYKWNKIQIEQNDKIQTPQNISNICISSLIPNVP